MGANAATKALRVFENYQRVMGVEILSAAQGADLREGNTSPTLSDFLQLFRQEVKFIEDDIILSPEMEKISSILS